MKQNMRRYGLEHHEPRFDPLTGILEGASVAEEDRQRQVAMQVMAEFERIRVFDPSVRTEKIRTAVNELADLPDGDYVKLEIFFREFPAAYGVAVEAGDVTHRQTHNRNLRAFAAKLISDVVARTVLPAQPLDQGAVAASAEVAAARSLLPQLERAHADASAAEERAAYAEGRASAAEAAEVRAHAYQQAAERIAAAAEASCVEVQRDLCAAHEAKAGVERIAAAAEGRCDELQLALSAAQEREEALKQQLAEEQQRAVDLAQQADQGTASVARADRAGSPQRHASSGNSSNMASLSFSGPSKALFWGVVAAVGQKPKGPPSRLDTIEPELNAVACK